MCKNFVCGLFMIIGIFFLLKSKKMIYKKNYLYKSIAYLLFYTSIFLFLEQYLSLTKIKDKLDVFVTISATLAGFVFSGLAIIFALIEFEHIKSLFRNDFLDNLFYKGYGCIALCVCNIAIYIIHSQYDLENKYILAFNQYVLGAAILLLFLLLLDFVFTIKQLKKGLKNKK